MALSQAEQDELHSLQAAPAPKPAGLTPAEHAELQELSGSTPPPSGVSGAFGTGLRVAGKALDYQRGAGAVRIDLLAQSLGASPGMPPEQAAAALNPTTTTTAPSYRDLLRNWGVPPGPSTADIPKHAGILGAFRQRIPDISARAATGTVADAALDPMSYESGGLGRIAEALKEVPVAGKAAAAVGAIPRAASTLGKAASEKMYESGISDIIKAGKQYGNPKVGETMLEEGITGGARNIQAGMQDSARRLKEERDAILSMAAEGGATGTPKTALDNVSDKLQELVSAPRLDAPTARKILSDLAKPLGETGPQQVSPVILSAMKTDVAKGLPGATWNELSTAQPQLAKEIANSYRAGLRQVGEDAVGSYDPAAAQALTDTNARLGDLINPYVKKAAGANAIKESHSPWLSKSEMLLGLGIGGSAGAAAGHTAGYTLEGGLGGLATLGALKAATSPEVRTTAGWLGDRILNAPGVSPFVDSVARQTVAGATRKSPYVIPAQPKGQE